MPKLNSVPAINEADLARIDGARRHNGYRRFLKRRKVRAERRRAKLNPEEALPMYNRYRGWEA